MPVPVMPACPVDSDNTEGHHGGDGMCEVVLNTGNITLESGIARGTVNPFNFILTCALPGRVRPSWSGSVWRRG